MLHWLSVFFEIGAYMKVLIVLDIDGTITNCHDTMPAAVAEYFSALQALGVVFAFVTGRTFSRGIKSLQALSFPYYFSVQNGALLLKMNEMEILRRKYLGLDVIPVMDEICHAEGSDYVLYSGFEGKDITYYREGFFPIHELDFLLKRSRALQEDWRPVASFEGFAGPIVSLKFFGPWAAACRIAAQIEERLNLHVPVINDPFDRDHCIVQATHPEASKGGSLQEIKALDPTIDVVIAAGDDTNDLSMLEQADISIAMENAPEALLEIADIIAPSADREGIIQGLEHALQMIERKGV